MDYSVTLLPTLAVQQTNLVKNKLLYLNYITIIFHKLIDCMKYSYSPIVIQSAWLPIFHRAISAFAGCFSDPE